MKKQRDLEYIVVKDLGYIYETNISEHSTTFVGKIEQLTNGWFKQNNVYYNPCYVVAKKYKD